MATSSVPAPSSAARIAADLAVHHPARRDHVGAGRGLGDRDLRRSSSSVASLSTVPSAREQAAVAVVGVLVEAEVGDQHQLVAEVVAQLAQRHAGRSPSGSQAPEPVGVLGRGHAEEDDAGDAERRRAAWPRRRAMPRCAGTGRAARRSARASSMPSRDEERRDEVVDASTLVSATSRRSAGVRRSRRGRRERATASAYESRPRRRGRCRATAAASAAAARCHAR